MYILQTVFDWIFPPSEENKCVRELTRETVVSFYNQRIESEVVVLSSYKVFQLKALVQEAKFHNNKKAQLYLGMLMQKYITNMSNTYDFIIPIPLSSRRHRERGHNQVVSILEESNVCLPINTKILKRIRHTERQTDLPKTKREKNVQSAFDVADPSKISGKRILLVDDVMTTGATLRAAKASLLPHSPASVTCLAIAH